MVLPSTAEDEDPELDPDGKKVEPAEDEDIFLGGVEEDKEESRCRMMTLESTPPSS